MSRSRGMLACVLALTTGSAFCGCQKPNQSSETSSLPEDKSARIEALTPVVRTFCGDCHAFPPPETFPQDAWFAEVEQGYRFYLESGRSDLHPPPMRDVVEFYRNQAPKKLELSSFPSEVSHHSLFRKQSLPQQRNAPAISFIDAAPTRGPGAIWLCDMHSGVVSVATVRPEGAQLDVISQLANPAHAMTCDLNQDGRGDLLVAELGSYVPGDHELGKIYWIDGAAESGGTGHEANTILEHVGRIADVRAADFDSDGDLDLIVAEFGWRKSGSIRLLEQTGNQGRKPTFTEHVVDRRHGAIHVPVADLNQDGLPDFVALISQEHEVVEAFLNRGGGRFEKQTLFAAPDPAFGSSGIEIVDLDHDGDLDVLYTNGDTLDSHYLKPAHGVIWLENRGEFPFHARKIAPLPGAMRAASSDIDADGDLDIVAVAFLPAALRQQFSGSKPETLVWLEQGNDLQFKRHALEVGEAGHMSVLASDLDGDGDVDLAVPNYAEQRSVQLSPLTVWWNTRVD